MTRECPECAADIDIGNGFERMGEEILCPQCGAKWEVDFEESYDSLYFWLTPYRPS